MINSMATFIGYAVMLGFLALLLLVIAAHLWCYLAYSIAYFAVHIQADKAHPNAEIIKHYAKNKTFWRTRLLLLILSRPRFIIGLHGSTLHGKGWTINFESYWPR